MGRICGVVRMLERLDRTLLGHANRRLIDRPTLFDRNDFGFYLKLSVPSYERESSLAESSKESKSSEELRRATKSNEELEGELQISRAN